MIIGNGDIASAIKDRGDVIFFASGVSNSQERRTDPYERERKLLLEQDRDNHLVYFSSLSIYYNKKSMYASNKQVMEAIVQSHWASYTIVRIGNIAWGKNPHTLLNYLKATPKAQYREVYRFILSMDEFNYWIDKIIVPGRNEMNIPGKMVWVPDLKMQMLMKNISGNDAIW